MNFTPCAIPDVVLVAPRVFGDARGFFLESWHAEKFARAGIDAAFVQDNHSRSVRGVLRGLHYQVARPQGKLVRVLVGEIFDVAVDLRDASPTFGQHVSAVLSAENHHQLWIPPGFAHGFLVLSEAAEVSYKCTTFYAPELERAVAWDDPGVAVRWPLAPGERPILSAKDAVAPPLAEAERFA
jgi:dTDP-4-dehydrorhamnose 3,5-epimerase